MFAFQNTTSNLVVGALALVLSLASAAQAQQGPGSGYGAFEGHYSGIGDATGAGLTLAQSGQRVVGQLLVDGAIYVIEATVSGSSGQGVVGDPSSGAMQAFGLQLHGADLVVMLPQVTSGPQVFRFRRGVASASGQPSYQGGGYPPQGGGGDIVLPDNDPNPTNDPFLPGGDSFEFD